MTKAWLTWFNSKADNVKVRSERNILAQVAGHPFITTMVASFQDEDSLYMIVRLKP